MTRTLKKKKMLPSIFRRAFARGKVTNLVTIVVALTLAMVTPALAATGGNFILGKANTATDPSGTATGITQLTANIANPAMKLINTSTSTRATALNLVTAATRPPMTVNSQTKVDNLNADMVDGNDSMALGVTMKTNHATTAACTTPTTWTECAPVTVKVPTGKQYHVTVLSSFAAAKLPSTSAGNVKYCPAIKGGSFGLSCITPNPATGQADSIDLPDDQSESGASSGEIGSLPAGTYTFSTAMNPSIGLFHDTSWKAHTTVLVRDVSAPGPPIS